MGAIAKLIGIILLVIIVIVGVIGFDIYLTVNTLSDVDPNNLVSSPNYTVSSDNSTITISIDVDLPKAGFIPKGVIIDLMVTFDGDVQTATREVNLGEKTTLDITFTLTSAHAQTLATGGSLTVKATAKVTPTVVDNPIDLAAQDIDLGSQTITA